MLAETFLEKLTPDNQLQRLDVERSHKPDLIPVPRIEPPLDESDLDSPLVHRVERFHRPRSPDQVELDVPLGGFFRERLSDPLPGPGEPSPRDPENVAWLGPDELRITEPPRRRGHEQEPQGGQPSLARLVPPTDRRSHAFDPHPAEIPGQPARRFGPGPWNIRDGPGLAGSIWPDRSPRGAAYLPLIAAEELTRQQGSEVSGPDRGPSPATSRRPRPGATLPGVGRVGRRTGYFATLGPS